MKNLNLIELKLKELSYNETIIVNAGLDNGSDRCFWKDLGEWFGGAAAGVRNAVVGALQVGEMATAGSGKYSAACYR